VEIKNGGRGDKKSWKKQGRKSTDDRVAAKFILLTGH
jgi:hypothetical protein